VGLVVGVGMGVGVGLSACTKTNGNELSWDETLDGRNGGDG